MITLDVQTSMTLQAVMQAPPATIQPSYYCYYRRKNPQNIDGIDTKTSAGFLNGITSVDIVSAPISPATIHEISYIRIPNLDSASISVQISRVDSDGPTTIPLTAFISVPVGNTLEYANGSFRVVDENGALKTRTGMGSILFDENYQAVVEG